jgi:tetratricopeptide (TPR) repeat protein
MACATLQDMRADHLRRQTHFVSSSEILHRLTRLFPKQLGLRERVAHEISFNISREFDGNETKYFWVRQGINVLLNGAEQNPESVDLVWVAAKFIEIKFGRADEAREFRKLFAKDTELHRRLQRYANLERARNRDGDVDCFLTAGLMFEYCVRESAQSATSSIPPFVVASQPVVSAAALARALDRDGKVEDAAVQWKIAEELCEELGKKEIQYDSKTRLPIRSAEERLSSIEEPLLGTITLDYAWYATQLFQARLEQNTLSRRIREHEFRAREFLGQMKKEDALGEYQLAMQQLATIVEEDPDFADHALRNFSGLLKAFNELARELERPIPSELRTMILLRKTLEQDPLIEWRLR